MSNGRDVLLYGASDTERYEHLIQWAEAAGMECPTDYHRLQLENWLWGFRFDLIRMPLVLDVGVYDVRRWVGKGYKTFGFKDADIVGDLTDIPLKDASVGAIICTEVLEHCEDPFAACREMKRVLKPNGLLLVTSPFLWPWHGTTDYKDFWRFTEDGWRLLLKSFNFVRVTACDLTDEGKAAYDVLRRFECMGMRTQTKITTGYLCEARK